MQRIKVSLEFELEVPDDWSVPGTEEAEVGSLLANGERYEPGLMWMKCTDTGDGTSVSEQVDADTQLMLMDCITECTESIECL